MKIVPYVKFDNGEKGRLMQLINEATTRESLQGKIVNTFGISFTDANIVIDKFWKEKKNDNNS